MTRQTIIRAATTEDATLVHTMVVALAVEIGKISRVKSNVKDFSRLGLKEGGYFQALLAENDGQAVGLSLYFYSFSRWRGTPGVYIQDLYVAESERGTGLGQRLLQKTAEMACEQGATYLRLAVDHQNNNAAAFYRHIGLQHCEEDQIFMAKGIDFKKLCTQADEQ